MKRVMRTEVFPLSRGRGVREWKGVNGL